MPSRARKLAVSLLIPLSASLLVSPVMADRTTADPTRTQIALPLETPPVIDGFIDVGEWTRAGGAAGNFWQVVFDANLEDSIRGGQLGDGSTNPPIGNEDLSFDIMVGYDADNLYIAVRVRDDSIQTDDAEAGSANGNTWLDDSVEIFIDGDNSNFATRDVTGTNPEIVDTGGQFVITASNAYREAEAGNPGYGEDAAWYAMTALTDVGYEAEFRISLDALGNPGPGDIIGFTVAVNDDDDGGETERQVIWIGQPHTEATYGNLILNGRSYTAPKVTTAPTIDGVINTAEYAGATEIVLDAGTAVFDIPSGDDNIEPTDLSYRAWVVHDADAVYVAVNVTDDMVVTDSAEADTEDGTTWEDDSIEIFFDANNSKDDGRGAELYEGQYVLSANGAWRDNEANNPTFGQDADWFAATSTTPNGYAIEFKITKAALLSPEDGAIMGFHIAVNDDDGVGRSAQMGWSGRAHSEFTYGTLILGEGAPPIGDLSVSGIQINGDNLEITIATSSPASTHAIERATDLASPQWSEVTGVTFDSGEAGSVVARFPRPTNSPEFYRAVRR